MLSSCNDVAHSVLNDQPSPNAAWHAVIEKEEHGGLGTAGTIYTVSLLRKGERDRPIVILSVEDDGTKPVFLKAVWTSNNKLSVEAKGGMIDFQAVQAAGIQISLSAS